MGDNVKKKHSAGKTAAAAAAAGTGRRTALIVLCSVLSAVLVVLVAGTVYMNHMLGKINRSEETQAPTLSQEEIHALENPDPEVSDFTGPAVDDVTWAEDDETEIAGDHIVNILLIGQDRRPGEGRSRSDAMILCTFNKEHKTLTMTSFLRDLYVQIPGYRDNRINVAYALGGMELLNDTLEKNFGIKVNGNVEVDFNEFSQIIDLLGGVDLELTGAEAKYINSDMGTSLRTGMNHMNGKQALTYARIRYLDSDFGRTNRQRNVLEALVNAYKNASLPKMLSLLDDILPIVTTDMSDKEIIGYATDLFPMLASAKMTTQHIPADGTYEGMYVRGMAVLVPDLEANRALLVESLMENK